MGDFFGGVVQAPVQTAAGPCQLPILYRDATLLGLMYRLEPSRVASVLDGLPLEPMVVFGKALGLVVVFEYRDTTVGQYNEIGLGVHVKRTGSRPGRLRSLLDMRPQEDQALYVVNLPVTTQSAFAAGRDVWGYKKYVTGIHTDFSRDGGQVILDGELDIRVGKLRGIRAPGLPFVTYSVRDGELVRTIIRTGHTATYATGGNVDLRLIGEGPTASSIEKLGLDGKKPMAAFRTDAMRAILPKGRVVGRVAAPTAASAPELRAAAGM